MTRYSGYDLIICEHRLNKVASTLTRTRVNLELDVEG